MSTHALVLDLDETMIEGNSSIILLEIAGKGNSAAAELIQRARGATSMLRSQTADRADMAKLYKSSGAMLAKIGVTRGHIIQAAMKIALKPGTREVLFWAREKNLLVALVTAGCADLAEAVLEDRGLKNLVARVFGTRLAFNSAGLVTGVDEGTFVCPSHKGEPLGDFLGEKGIPAKNVIAVGNSRGDEGMQGPQGTLIAFDPAGSMLADCYIRGKKSLAAIIPFLNEIVRRPR